MIASPLVTAAVPGTFAGAFVASASLFRVLFGSIRQAMFVARGMLSSLGHRLVASRREPRLQAD